MPLSTGTTIGPYKVEHEIGRGGMGVVFLARDTRLGRTVALKALPEDVAQAPDRLQRFEREARVLASLNHPNVAAIYGLEEADGRKYLALEHIEGETLAQRLAHGPLPLPEALDVCIQIAAGMEAAHDAGVIHRDLKPANVMITPGEHVKVLDFGLAKGRVATDESGLAKSPALIDSPAISSPTIPHSPTFMGTIPGVILGTAGYISPEQARGKVVDRRTDIWSFGCVLYECLTGRLLFEGESVPDTIARVLERPIDWSALPSTTPPRLRELLERCLERDPRRRLRDIGDARLTLEEIRSGRYPAPEAASAAAVTPERARAARQRTALLVAAAAILGALLGAAAWNAMTRGRATNRVMHLTLQLPRDVRFEKGVIDEQTIAVVCGPLGAGEGQRALRRLYMRKMDEPEFQTIPGTEGTRALFLSPDGRTLEYWAPAGEGVRDLRRFRMPTDRSAPPVSVGDVGSNWDDSGVWLGSGDLIVAVNDGLGYVRVPANGGAVSAPARFDVPVKSGRFYPEGRPLPGDRGVFLRAIWYEGNVYHQGIGVLDPKSGKTKIVLRDGGSAAFKDGALLFTRMDALYAVRFDPGRLEAKGTPVGIMNGLRQDRTAINARFGLTPDGMLGYASGGNVMRSRHLIVADRQGKVSEWSPVRRPFEYDLKASPDGRRASTQINNANAITELWIQDRGEGTARRIRMRPGADCLGHCWSPDARWIAYGQNANDPSDGVYVVDADGVSNPRRVAKKPSPTSFFVPSSWAPDGTILTTVADSSRVAIWGFQMPGDGGLGVPRQIVAGEGTRGLGMVSPNGRVMAYQSDESGQAEQYIVGWAGGAMSGPSIMVSRGGGASPRWSPDGATLYYSNQAKLMSVQVQATPQLSASPPTLAWDLGALRVPPNATGSALYDILPEGRLLAVQAGEEEEHATQIDVVLHFDEVVKQRMRAAAK